MICGEPIAECMYGWGHVLRLYQSHLEIQGKLYALSDLLNFKPSYHHVLGISSMRLELQFVSGTIVVRGVADIGSALNLIFYLNTWNDATVALMPKGLSEASQEPFSDDQISQPLVLTDAPRERFWEYDAHDHPTTLVDLSESLDATDPALRLSLPLSLPPPAQPPFAVSWTDELYAEHDQCLQRLQVEREIRFYGFDVAALAKRLRDESLVPIMISLPLHEGEVAYYRTEVRLFDEFSGTEKRTKAKDQGTLLLTNQRMIYLGQKRRIMLGYAHLLQIEHVKGALVLSTEYWPKKQFFGMQQPLECAMYLEHALHCFQQSNSSAYVQTQAFNMPS